MRRLVFLLLVATLACGSVRAEPLPEAMRDSLGDWLAVPDDGQPGCRLTLTETRTIGGWSVEPAPTCAARLPRLADAYAWDYERGVRVFDATRKAIMTFEEDETTLMKTRGAAIPAVMLVRAKAGVERAPNAAAVVGTWAMRRPGGPTLCEVTFLPAGNGDTAGAALRLGKSCDSAITRLKLARWQIEDFALMLYGDGSLRFEPGPDGFEKAEAGLPLSLVKLR